MTSGTINKRKPAGRRALFALLDQRCASAGLRSEENLSYSARFAITAPPPFAPKARVFELKPPPPCEPVELRRRYDGWTAEKQNRFLEVLADTGCVTDACRSGGMSDTAYKLRNRRGFPARVGRGARLWRASARAGGVGQRCPRRCPPNLPQARPERLP